MTIPRGGVRAISFDYGHVLGGLDLGHLAARIAELGHPAQADAIGPAMVAAYRAHDEAIAASLGHQAAWRALMAVLVRAACASDLERDEELRVVEALWCAQPTRNLWRHVPEEARAMLEAIEACGVPMVVTSNSEGRAAELLAEVDLARHFVAIIDSGVIGVSKPDRRIFEAAAIKVGVPLAQIVHIGDSETADVVGAKGAGAYAIRFDRFVPGSEHSSTIADERARTFSELRGHLGLALDRAL